MLVLQLVLQYQRLLLVFRQVFGLVVAKDVVNITIYVFLELKSSVNVVHCACHVAVVFQVEIDDILNVLVVDYFEFYFVKVELNVFPNVILASLMAVKSTMHVAHRLRLQVPLLGVASGQRPSQSHLGVLGISKQVNFVLSSYVGFHLLRLVHLSHNLALQVVHDVTVRVGLEVFYLGGECHSSRV